MARYTFKRAEFEAFIAKQALDISKTVAFQVRDEIRDSMANSPEDISKSYYYEGSTRHPSFPGNPPTVQTGRLHDSISVNWQGSGMSRGEVGSRADRSDGIEQPKGKGEVVVGTKAMRRSGKGAPAPYWYYLEFGTGIMEKRPYLAGPIKKGRKMTDDAAMKVSKNWDKDALRFLGRSK